MLNVAHVLMGLNFRCWFLWNSHDSRLSFFFGSIMIDTFNSRSLLATLHLEKNPSQHLKWVSVVLRTLPLNVHLFFESFPSSRAPPTPEGTRPVPPTQRCTLQIEVVPFILILWDENFVTVLADQSSQHPFTCNQTLFGNEMTTTFHDTNELKLPCS